VEVGTRRCRVRVQRCKPAYGLCKSAKVKDIVSGGGWQPRVASGEVGTAPRAVLGAKVQIGLRPVQRCKSGSWD
jgi:hypothetical protein